MGGELGFSSKAGSVFVIKSRARPIFVAHQCRDIRKLHSYRLGTNDYRSNGIGVLTRCLSAVIAA